MPRFNRGGSEKGEMAGVERRREREERERKGRRHDGRKGRKEGMGNLDGGGELRHCS